MNEASLLKELCTLLESADDEALDELNQLTVELVPVSTVADDLRHDWVHDLATGLISNRTVGAAVNAIIECVPGLEELVDHSPNLSAYRAAYLRRPSDDITDRNITSSSLWMIGQKRTAESWNLDHCLTGLLTDSPISYIMPPHIASIGAKLCPFPCNLELKLSNSEAVNRKENKHMLETQCCLKKLLGALLFIANKDSQAFLASLVQADKVHDLDQLPEGNKAHIALEYAIAAVADHISKIEQKKRILELNCLTLSDHQTPTDPSKKKRKCQLTEPITEAPKVIEKTMAQARKARSFSGNHNGFRTRYTHPRRPGRDTRH